MTGLWWADPTWTAEQVAAFDPDDLDPDDLALERAGRGTDLSLDELDAPWPDVDLTTPPPL